MNVDASVIIARPHPGALSMVAGDVVLREVRMRSRLASHATYQSATAFFLALAGTDAEAVGLLELAARAALPLFECWPEGHDPLQVLALASCASGSRSVAMVWTDGRWVRLCVHGAFRVVFWRGGVPQHLPDGPAGRPRMSDLVMENGDWVVVTTPATVTALPLGSILKLIHPGLAAQDVCRRAAEIAARTDPLDHHAVAAFAFHDDHVTLAAQRSLS